MPWGGYQPWGCIDSVSCLGLEQVSLVVTDSLGFSCLTEILGSVTVVVEDCPQICHSCVGQCIWIVTVSTNRNSCTEQRPNVRTIYDEKIKWTLGNTFEMTTLIFL